MSLFFVAECVILGGLLVGTAVLSRVPAFQTWRIGKLAERVGLGVPDELDGMIRDRVASRLLASSIGGVIGLVPGVFLSWGYGWTRGDMNEQLVALYVVLAGSATGTALGTAWAALRAETRLDDRPRIARADVVTISDYIVSLLRGLAWAVVVLAAVTVAVVRWQQGALRGPGLSVGPGEVLVVIAVACLILFEVLGRRLVRRGRPSTSTDELVWNDALTSSALRAMLYAPVLAVGLGSYWTVITPGPASPSGLSIGVALSLLGVYAVFAWIYRSTPTWYLTQLWPNARRGTPEERQARRERESAQARHA
ncbi:hypothetical protein EDF46_2993 [Frondihabitans sp. PhB188]|uniref:hypothetical protein n=1 Tax=Frondihabitans sp. PhB188 TaxID=2485200 RepID=UPI000F475A3C|nr:hypothetical protein [Frondihabitans sp. PhB188]ROQ37534.1 hypothetical protein EDF46_2993 [Frondihabitans sp. PhB188]